MKNITNNTEITRTTNGGGVTVGAVLGAMDLIHGAYEACKWAANLGYSWGTQIGKWIFG